MIALGSSKAEATTYQDLCTAVPRECEYTGPVAPVLATSVCWNRTTGVTRLMTNGTCPSGSYPFSIKYGIVDPFTAEVLGLIPVPDACSRPGICSPGYLAPDNTWSAAAMCCIDGVCWPQVGIGGCDGEVLICFEGVTNEDGTVECFDDTPV